MRPPLSSRTNSRPTAALRPGLVLDFEFVVRASVMLFSCYPWSPMPSYSRGSSQVATRLLERNSFGYIAHDERERGFDPLAAVRHIALEPDGIKHPTLVRHAGGRDAPERPGLDDASHVCLERAKLP